MIAFDRDVSEDCSECPCLDAEWRGCQAVSGLPLIPVDGGRPEWCPWIEVSNDRIL